MVESMKHWRRGVVELKFLKTITLKTYKISYFDYGIEFPHLNMQSPENYAESGERLLVWDTAINLNVLSVRSSSPVEKKQNIKTYYETQSNSVAAHRDRILASNFQARSSDRLDESILLYAT